MTKEESGSISLCDEAQIGRIVFRAISDTAGVELRKIEAELTRQLDAILGEDEHEETEVLRYPCVGGFSADTVAKMKRVMGQLFLHLQRALVLNIAQSLSERLTTSINEMAEEVADTEAQNKQLSNDVTLLREKLSDLSERIKEYERKPSQYGKMEGEAEKTSYEEISVSVDRFISRTHQLTEVLAELSKKYLELREGNSGFKQTSAIQ